MFQTLRLIHAQLQFWSPSSENSNEGPAGPSIYCRIYGSASLSSIALDALKTHREKNKCVCGVYIHLTVASYVNYTRSLMSWHLTLVMYTQPVHLHHRNRTAIVCSQGVCVCLCVRAHACRGCKKGGSGEIFIAKSPCSCLRSMLLDKMDFFLLYT